MTSPGWRQHLRRMAAAAWLGAGLFLTDARALALAVQTNPVPSFATVPPAASTNVPLRDIHDVVQIPNPWRHARWAVPAVLAAAAVTAGLAVWRRKKQAAAGPEVAESPAEEARRRLEAAREFIRDPRRFGGAVSDAVRLYLEARFGLRAPEQTTEEFLADLRKRPTLDLRHQNLLADFLEQCDFLKFAGARPGPEVTQDLLSAATRLVDETDPGTPAGPSTGVVP